MQENSWCSLSCGFPSLVCLDWKGSSYSVPQKNREMESSRQTSVKCLILIKTSLFFIPNFKNYKFVTYSNFPWTLS